jgi:hypothetical protein
MQLDPEINARAYHNLLKIIDDIKIKQYQQSIKATNFYNVSKKYCISTDPNTGYFLSEVNSMGQYDYNFDTFLNRRLWVNNIEVCTAISKYYDCIKD